MTETTFKQPEDYALVVGIDHYLEERDRLKGAVASAKAFREWLIDPHGGGLPPENCIDWYSSDTPADPRPSESDIGKALCPKLIALTKKKAKCRRLYVYFSGHGVAERVTGGAGLCAAGWSREYRNAIVNSEDYRDGITTRGIFSEIMMLLDCCRSNLSNPKGVGLTCDLASPRPGAEETRSFAAYAAPFNRSAWEGNQGEMFQINGQQLEVWGYFTRTLLRGLMGACADPDGVVRAGKLADYIEQETKSAANRDDKIQMARVEPRLTADTEICRVPVKANIKITFQQPRAVELESPDLEIIERGDFTTDDVWELTLAKGIYRLYDRTNDEERLIRFVPSDEVRHERF